MKKFFIKFLISIFLILYSFNVFADFKWKKIGSNVSGSVLYVDALSIKRVGNKAFFFTMMDYASPKEGVLSNRIYQEINCTDFTFRYLKDFYYPQPMANGEPIATIDEPSEWKSTRSGSIGEEAFKFVCK